MTHKLIHTPNYLLVVDDSEIKEGNKSLLNVEGFEPMILTHHEPIEEGYEGKKIIAHLPLNNSPILEGVDLLPPLEQEDDVEKLAKSAFTHPDFGKYKVGSIAYYNGYKEGYNKAKEKYKYTEEDIDKAYWAGMKFVGEDKGSYGEFIQSLSQPKMPIGFECEIEYFYMSSRMFYKDADWVKCNKDQYESIKEEIPTCPLKKVHKEISTPEGHTQWVGKYIY